MSDWNTLHFFDDKAFYTKVVPDLLGKGELLKKHFESKLGNSILWGNSNSDQRISAILNFCQSFDDSFKSHKVLRDIFFRKKKPEEQYSDFVHARNRDEKEFESKYNEVIYDLSQIFPLLLFSECASFNPHLILGRRIFTSRVHAKPKSVAKDVISNINYSEGGSVCFSDSSGIMNWITNDDLQLLWMDKENLFAPDEDSETYFQDFLKFIEIALENNLGVISGSNMKESVLKLIEKPVLTVNLDLEALGLTSVINYG